MRSPRRRLCSLHLWVSQGEVGHFREGSLPIGLSTIIFGVAGATGAVILVPVAAPAILGGLFGIGAAGPIAGGAFAGIQAGGAVAAGGSWAVIQSIAMGGALPTIGAVGAGVIGGGVAAAGRAVAGAFTGV
jgi:hypothetical protein